MTDLQLLQKYADQQSEPAFQEIVSRHINLVHSAALRQVYDSHLAEDVTQSVFLVLAKKAASFKENGSLAGWLYRTTKFVAADALKIQRRRQKREQEAYLQSIAGDDHNEALWAQIWPILDEAMAHLREKDREVLVLRYFENKSLKEVGDLLGLEERTAQKRVQRAIEKLRTFILRRGVISTSAVLISIISANAVQAAPASLASAISTAVTGKAVVGGSTFLLMKGALKTSFWANFKTAFTIGIITLLTSGFAVVAIHTKIEADRESFLWTHQNILELPPVVIVRSAANKYESNYRRNGEKYRGIGQPLPILFEAAYGFGPQRMILPGTNFSARYDFISTIPRAQMGLQTQILKQLKLSATIATNTSECLVLHLRNKGPNLRPPNGFSYVYDRRSKGEIEIYSGSFAAFCHVLEKIVDKPVIDESGASGVFNFSFQWDPQDVSLSSINSRLRSQLGVELEQSSRPIEMLVVKNLP